MTLDHSQEHIEKPKLSSKFWQFINKSQIPVASSFSYRNALGSYYERRVTKNEVEPKYMHSLDAREPISERRTAYHTENISDKVQSVIGRRSVGGFNGSDVYPDDTSGGVTISQPMSPFRDSIKP